MSYEPTDKPDPYEAANAPPKEYVFSAEGFKALIDDFNALKGVVGPLASVVSGVKVNVDGLVEWAKASAGKYL